MELIPRCLPSVARKRITRSVKFLLHRSANSHDADALRSENAISVDAAVRAHDRAGTVNVDGHQSDEALRESLTFH